MYTLIKNTSVKQVVTRELPALGLSFVIAEFFFKFGSFILECIAFMCTWYIVSFLFNKLLGKARKKKQDIAIAASANDN